MKKTVSILLLLALCLTLVGCGGGSSASTEEPSVLTVALAGQPEHLDVGMSTMDIASEVVYGSVYEKLVAFTGDNTVIPELAESWEITEGNTVYTYHLRKGVKFHDGQEMKADDVVASMNRWIDAAANAQTLTGDARFAKVDDYTVAIRMEKGTLYLNEMIAGLGQQAVIMPASVIGSVGAGELIKEYIGTGPYAFDEWKADQYIRLKANGDYQPYGTEGDYSGWGGYKRAWYDQVYFYFPGDNATVVSGVQTGEYDMADQLNGDDYAAFTGKSEFTIFSDEAEMPMLIFNKSQGVASDAAVRRAVQAVVNCEDVLFASYGNPDLYKIYSSYMFEASSTWYTEAGSEYYNQKDPEKAKELFAQAGWTDGDVFRILVRTDSANSYAQAQVIQGELDDIGVSCELVACDASTYSDTRNNHPEAWDAFITSFGPKVLPNMNLFLSASWAGWCDDERIQSDLSSIASDSDLASAQKTWEDLQRYMYEDFVPVVKFGSTQLSGVCKSTIQGALIKERLVWIDARPAA
jgi:peptide/nickel transport system substrate-binding protein